MGILQLPTYTPTQIETHKVREVRPDLDAKARMGQSVAALQNTVASGISELGRAIAARYRETVAQREADEENRARIKIVEGDHTSSKTLSAKPITVDSPEYGTLTAEEQAEPNYSYFMRDHDTRVSGVLDGIKNGRVRQRVETWAKERRITVGDALGAWDAAQAKAVGMQNLQKDLDTCIRLKDAGTADYLIESAWQRRGLITEKQARDYSDRVHLQITQSNTLDMLKALPVEEALKKFEAKDEMLYVRWDGSEANIPDEAKKALMSEYKDFVNKRDDEYSRVNSISHLNANTLADVDAAMVVLKGQNYGSAQTRYEWEMRMRSLRDSFIKRDENASKDAADAEVKKQKEAERKISGPLAVHILTGNIPAAYRLLLDSKGVVSGTFLYDWGQRVQPNDDPMFVMTQGLFQDWVSKSKPTIERQGQLAAQLYDTYSQARAGGKKWTTQDAQDIMKSLVTEDWKNIVRSYGDLRDVIGAIGRGEAAVLNEEWTRTLGEAGAASLRLASERYPEAGIDWASTTYFLDTQNLYGLKKNYPIMQDLKSQEIYAWIPEGKEIVLVKSTMKGEPLKRVWVPVSNLTKPEIPEPRPEEPKPEAPRPTVLGSPASEREAAEAQRRRF